jgi:hypothetical protein
MKAVFALTYDKTVLGPENYLTGVKNNQPQKNTAAVF